MFIVTNYSYFFIIFIHYTIKLLIYYISNDKLYKLIQDLSDKINKLNDKVDYQTNIILNLTKENNIFKDQLVIVKYKIIIVLISIQ